ncbi:MAG: hypothetical protein M3Y27_27000, partial [Acidobacteriota bacterium]|nr:hypothetical protein [Acidobacteriota bacterium]
SSESSLSGFLPPGSFGDSSQQFVTADQSPALGIRPALCEVFAPPLVPFNVAPNGLIHHPVSIPIECPGDLVQYFNVRFLCPDA